jgi:hypothetical protein
MNLSKCSLRILSMPLGRDGNGPDGLLIFLTRCSQKHLGQSNMRFIDDGDNLYVMFCSYSSSTPTLPFYKSAY